MKFLKLFIAFVLLLNMNTSYAQLEKGNLLVGGNAGLNLQFNQGDNTFSLFLNPHVLTFVSDNLAVGGSLGLNYFTAGSFSSFGLSILPSGRYYFPGEKDNLAFFVNGQVGLQLLNSNLGSGTDSALAFGFGPGVSFFLSEDVAIDTGLSFNRFGGAIDTSSLNLTFGFQFFLNRKRKEK